MDAATAMCGLADLGRFPRLLALVDQARKLPRIRAAIVHPCAQPSLAGALEACALGMIEPVLVGPRRKIAAAAAAAGLSLAGLAIEDAPHSHAAAERAVDLVRAGAVDAIMKGALHTDEVMGAVVRDVGGLKTERRVSHIFVIDAPLYSKPVSYTHLTLPTKRIV